MPGLTARRSALLALDVGTSGARAVAFDLDGERLIEVRHGYPTLTPRPGWAEQDPARWLSASLSALRRVVHDLGPARDVVALSLTGQCPSMVPVDRAGKPVGPGIIYRDNRATAEARWLRDLIGAEEIHRRTGHSPAAFHIGPKILWLRRHQPDVFRATYRVLQPRDLVLHTLTGEMVTDDTHAPATLFFDLRHGGWDAELARAADLDSALFPRLVHGSEVVGELRGRLAGRLGLPRPIPVIAGGADSQACAFGVGVIAAGPVSDMAGSSTCLNAVVPGILPDARITHYGHVVGDGLTTETGLNTTGEAVRWLAALLYTRGPRAPRGEDLARLDAEAAGVPPGSAGVLALVALGDGERDDPRARGGFTGLSLGHGRAVLARALLEGVAFAMREQLDRLRRCGVRVDELRVSGGGARLPAWNRIKADVIGLPIRPAPDDATAKGVAMLAGLGGGVYSSPSEAIDRAVRLAPAIEPDPDIGARYEEAYLRWRQLSRARAVRR